MQGIKGIGVDLVQISRITRILEGKISSRFLNRVLHVKERAEYQSFTSAKRRSEFVASRWAYKEAIVKATGNKKIIFNKVCLVKTIEGSIRVWMDEEYKDFKSDNLFVSLSHEDNLAIACAVLNDFQPALTEDQLPIFDFNI